VLADEGTVSVSYRGAGGYTIGDVITFDGKNTAGNTNLLKITGPGLLNAVFMSQIWMVFTDQEIR